MIVRAITMMILIVSFCTELVYADDVVYLSAQEMAATIGSGISGGGTPVLMFDDMCYYCEDIYGDTTCQEVCFYVGSPPDHHCTEIRNVVTWLPARCAETFTGWHENECSVVQKVCAKEYISLPKFMLLQGQVIYYCGPGPGDCGLSTPVWQANIIASHCTVTGTPTCNTGMMASRWSGITRYRHG